jgi:nitrogen regulatory protein P-II 2
MKLITAIIRPEKLEAVQAALNQHDVNLMSVSQVLGDPRESGYTEIYRGRECRVPRPKLRLEIVANDRFVEAAVEAITRAGSMGDPAQTGDGRVFVVHLDGCVRIPQGEWGPAVIET